MSGAEDGAAAEAAAPAQDLYREKPVSKLVRVMTVMAYLTSVSFAAILLSVYYICIWKSPEAPRGDDPGYLLARQGTHHDYESPYFSADGPRNLTGRGDTAVSNGTDAALDALNYTTTHGPAADDAPATRAPDTSAEDTTAPDTSVADDTTTPDATEAPTLAAHPAILTADT